MKLLSRAWETMFPQREEKVREVAAMGVRDFVLKRSNEHGVKYADVIGGGRHRRLADIRASIAAELRATPWGLSYPEIGRALGNRHHTTVMSMLGACPRVPRKRSRPCLEDHLCKDSAA